MFECFVLASNFKRIESRFSMAKLPEHAEYIQSYNIFPGNQSYVIHNIQTKEIHQFRFGLQFGETIQPFVRAEGDRNLSDNSDYKGSKAIFLKPEYNRLIRNQRCLVLADAFIVSTPETAYLVYLRDNQRPFAFAGIWDSFKNKDSGLTEYCFAIITTTANSMLLKLGIKRMPVILFNEYETSWLRLSAPLSEILGMLNPFPVSRMNGYPVSDKIMDRTQNNVSLVQPIGKPIFHEDFTYTRKRKSYDKTPSNFSWAERALMEKNQHDK